MQCLAAALVALATLRSAAGLGVQRDVPSDGAALHADRADQPPQLDPSMPTAGPSKADVLKHLSLMKVRSEDRDIIVEGCGMLSWRAGYDNNKDWMLKEGFVTVTLKALKKWPDDREVQWLCAGALTSAALYHEGIAEAAGSEGAVELVIEMMKRWPGDSKMQTGSMLGELMSVSENNRKRWVAAGGIRQALEALHKFHDDYNVVLSEITALSNGIQADVQHFRFYGGLDLLINFLKVHRHDHRIIEEVMKAGLQVATDPEVWPKLVGKNYIGLVVSAMKTERDDTFLQQPACQNLELFAKNPPHRTKAVKAGAIAAALDVIDNFDKNDAKSQVSIDVVHKTFQGRYHPDLVCMDALSALAADPLAKAKLVEAKALDVLQRAVAKRPYDGTIRRDIETVEGVMTAE